MLRFFHKIQIKLLCLFFTALLLGCTKFSEEVKDPSAGFNGGFEVSKHGLPVNWLMYTPNTVPNSKFEIILDKEDFKEGKQSLRFEVEECASTGGWGSPGFTNQFDAIEGTTYALSFWIKNKGSEIRISAGGVSPKSGDMKTLLRSNDQINDWKQYSYDVPIAKEFSELRIEVNVLSPGTFWIDDIQIEKQ